MLLLRDPFLILNVSKIEKTDLNDLDKHLLNTGA